MLWLLLQRVSTLPQYPVTYLLSIAQLQTWITFQTPALRSSWRSCQMCSPTSGIAASSILSSWCHYWIPVSLVSSWASILFGVLLQIVRVGLLRICALHSAGKEWCINHLRAAQISAVIHHLPGSISLAVRGPADRYCSPYWSFSAAIESAVASSFGTSSCFATTWISSWFAFLFSIQDSVSLWPAASHVGPPSWHPSFLEWCKPRRPGNLLRLSSP